MTDDLVAQAERHLARDRDLEERVDRAQRLAEAQLASPDAAVHAAGEELADIVGLPVGAPAVDVTAEWDRARDRWVDEQSGVE